MLLLNRLDRRRRRRIGIAIAAAAAEARWMDGWIRMDGILLSNTSQSDECVELVFLLALASCRARARVSLPMCHGSGSHEAARARARAKAARAGEQINGGDIVGSRALLPPLSRSPSNRFICAAPRRAESRRSAANKRHRADGGAISGIVMIDSDRGSDFGALAGERRAKCDL